MIAAFLEDIETFRAEKVSEEKTRKLEEALERLLQESTYGTPLPSVIEELERLNTRSRAQALEFARRHLDDFPPAFLGARGLAHLFVKRGELPEVLKNEFRLVTFAARCTLDPHEVHLGDGCSFQVFLVVDQYGDWVEGKLLMRLSSDQWKLPDSLFIISPFAYTVGTDPSLQHQRDEFIRQSAVYLSENQEVDRDVRLRLAPQSGARAFGWWMSPEYILKVRGCHYTEVLQVTVLLQKKGQDAMRPSPPDAHRRKNVEVYAIPI